MDYPKTLENGAVWFEINEPPILMQSARGRFCVLRNTTDYDKLVNIRIDGSFFHRVQPELDALERGETVSFATEPDVNAKGDPRFHRRLHLDQYPEGRVFAEPEPEPESDPRSKALEALLASPRTTKDLTFPVPLEMHSFLHAYSKKLKHKPECRTFSGFLSEFFKPHIRSLQMQHPDL